MPQVVLLPECQTVFTDPKFPGNLRLGLATMNHQLHCLALKLLVVSLLYLLFFHGLSHFTLRFRVRQIRGGSVYRLLVSQGLDRPRLIAQGSGPTKAFETELANALWMADVMDGPTLRVGDRVVHTFLFALLDDCSRLVPHGQYYDNERLGPLLDCL